MCFAPKVQQPVAPELPPPAPEPESTEDRLGTKTAIRKRRRRAALLGTEQLRIPTGNTGVNIP